MLGMDRVPDRVGPMPARGRNLAGRVATRDLSPEDLAPVSVHRRVDLGEIRDRNLAGLTRVRGHNRVGQTELSQSASGIASAGAGATCATAAGWRCAAVRVRQARPTSTPVTQ